MNDTDFRDYILKHIQSMMFEKRWINNLSDYVAIELLEFAKLCRGYGIVTLTMQLKSTRDDLFLNNNLTEEARNAKVELIDELLHVILYGLQKNNYEITLN